MSNKSTRWTPTPHQAIVAYCAVVSAHSQHMTFTVQGLCAMWGLNPNRHTRKVLQQLVKSGALAKSRALFDDGHYRDQFYAQHTRQLPWGGGFGS